MTKDEAIQILSTRDAHGVLCGYTSGVTESLDMAIEALSAEPKTGEWEERYVEDDECVWTRRRFYCSSCGNWNTYGKTSYCPDCGAFMLKGGEQSECE